MEIVLQTHANSHPDHLQFIFTFSDAEYNEEGEREETKRYRIILDIFFIFRKLRSIFGHQGI